MATELTSVVDVGGNLDVALLRVDGDIVEVFVLLQGELHPQLQAVPVLVHSVDQHGVVVVKLSRRRVNVDNQPLSIATRKSVTCAESRKQED